jgi:capsid protein
MGIRNWFAKQILTTRHGQQRGVRMYEAARRNRLLHDLVAPTSSADAELRVSLRVLRDRACQLCRDNPYARQAKRTTQINVVGPRGIQMQGLIMKAGGKEKDEHRNRMLEDAWRRWCRADTCDVAGRLSFQGFEMMIAGAFPESGECLVRIVRQPMGKGRVPIALELIEAHQLDEDKSGVSDRPGHEWRLGVELNQWGRPTRYAILTRHPGDVELGLNKRENRPERYNAPRWQARSWSWVDPAKEMKALEMARQLLLQTHGEQIAEYTGEQFEQVMAQAEGSAAARAADGHAGRGED